MKFTENFNLNLPDLDDMADVEKLNENFQTIDTTMKSLETDPELAANVVDIKNKIGTEADADTQPTLFGRLAQLKNVLLEKLAELLTKVTGIDGKIGTSGDTAEKNTLFGYIVSVHRSMNKKCVISKNKQFDVTFPFDYNRSTVTMLMLNRVSNYDGSILIELTNDLGPSTADSYLWAFS